MGNGRPIPSGPGGLPLRNSGNAASASTPPFLLLLLLLLPPLFIFDLLILHPSGPGAEEEKEKEGEGEEEEEDGGVRHVRPCR